MKTSPKTSVALLAILALGGGTAGSLFSESLQTNVINTIGTAGAFFPDVTMQIPNQQTVNVSDESKSEVEEDVIAFPKQPITSNPPPVAETQVRAITSPEVVPTPTSSAEPSAIPAPVASPESSNLPTPAPDVTPDITISQTPEPTPTP